MVATSRKKEGVCVCVCVCVCGALMAEEEEQPQKRRGGEFRGWIGCARVLCPSNHKISQ